MCCKIEEFFFPNICKLGRSGRVIRLSNFPFTPQCFAAFSNSAVSKIFATSVAPRQRTSNSSANFVLPLSGCPRTPRHRAAQLARLPAVRTGTQSTKLRKTYVKCQGGAPKIGTSGHLLLLKRQRQTHNKRATQKISTGNFETSTTTYSIRGRETTHECLSLEMFGSHLRNVATLTIRTRRRTSHHVQIRMRPLHLAENRERRTEEKGGDVRSKVLAASCQVPVRQAWSRDLLSLCDRFLAPQLRHRCHQRPCAEVSRRAFSGRACRRTSESVGSNLEKDEAGLLPGKWKGHIFRAGILRRNTRHRKWQND
eukprot:284819453_3